MRKTIVSKLINFNCLRLNALIKYIQFYLFQRLRDIYTSASSPEHSTWYLRVSVRRYPAALNAFVPFAIFSFQFTFNLKIIWRL